MAFSDLFATKSQPKATQSGFSGLFQQLPQEQLARRQQAAQLQYQEEQARKDEQYNKSLAGTAKNTALDFGNRLVKVPVDFLQTTYDIWKQTPGKFAESIQSGAADIEAATRAKDEGKSFAEGTTLLAKGFAKPALRTAGDAAIAIYAPLGGAISAVLNATGGTELVDKTGQVIADKSGITDIPAFQKFALEHPNAGEDFNRILNLAFSGAEKGTINPKAIADESVVIAEKLAGSPTSKATGAKAVLENRPIPVQDTSVQGKVSVTRPEATQSQTGFQALFKQEETVAPKETTARAVPENVVEVPELAPNTRAGKLLETAKLKGLIDDTGEIPTHQVKNMANDLDEAFSLIERNPDIAESIAMGDTAMKGIETGSVYKALEIKALENGDIPTIMKLAKSTAPTDFGRALKAFDSADPNSPVRIIRDIRASRASLAEKRGGKSESKLKMQEVKNIDEAIKKEYSKRPTWEQFINELTCGY